MSASEITDAATDVAGKTLVFLDTCFGDQFLRGRRGIADITSPSALDESGAVVVAAATGRQQPCAMEKAEWGNGAFTRALVEGLSGRADLGGRGVITVNLLDLSVSERVKELTHGRQTPVMNRPKEAIDFPVAVRQ